MPPAHRLLTRELGLRMHRTARMIFSKITKAIIITLALLLAPTWTGPVHAQSADSKTKSDNTAINKRDQSPAEVTADQQKMNVMDRNITAKIRRSIMADKSLSTYAHNVKVISQDGTVTLKGPVRSDAEQQTIVSKATDVTGNTDKVINQMSVAPTSKP
jgi:hyperosmotically inducible periplasmic protein